MPTGSSDFTARGTAFRLWAGIGFVVVVVGLLGYVLPPPAEWRRSIGNFVASLPVFREEASQAESPPADDVFWVGIAGEKAPTPSAKGAVAVSISGVDASYSLRETIRIEIRNDEANAAASYACSVERRSPAGWQRVSLPVDGTASRTQALKAQPSFSVCTSEMAPIPPGRSVTVGWNPATGNDGQTQVEPGEYRFAVTVFRDGSTGESLVEIRSQPFVLK